MFLSQHVITIKSDPGSCRDRRLLNPASVSVFLAVAAVIDSVSSSWGINAYILDQYVGGQTDLHFYLSVVMPLQGGIVPIVAAGDLLVGGAVGIVLLRQNYPNECSRS